VAKTAAGGKELTEAAPAARVSREDSNVAERLEDRIKVMVVDRLMLSAKPEELGDDDDLMAKWEVDSVRLMEIVIGLEEVFGIQLGDDEFSIRKFRTVANIAEVVRGKGVS
jgi:acyl carrier protein